MSRFRHYQTFVAAIDGGSFTAAARALDVSVAAVSKQIKALESATSTQLLDRTASGVRPTELGRMFYTRCRGILLSVESAEDDLRSAHQSMSGRISMTLSRSLAAAPFYKLLSRFSQAHPDISFDLMFNEELQNLRDDNIDFGFRIGRVDDYANLVAVPLQRVRPVLCASPGYMARLQERSNHLSAGKIMVTTPFGLSRPVRARLKKWGFIPEQKVAHTATDLDGVLGAVRGGLCMGVLLDVAITEDLNNGALVNVNPGEPLPSKQLYLLYSRERLKLRRHREFKNFARDYWKGLQL